MDRRALFFVIAAAASMAMYLPCPEEYRWVPVATAVTYLVLALMSWLDHRSRLRSGA